MVRRHRADRRLSRGEGRYTDPVAPFVDRVVEVGEEVGDHRVFRRYATGGGDVKKLRAAGIPAVEAAIGSDTARRVDEYVPLDALEAIAEWYCLLPPNARSRVMYPGFSLSC